MSGAIPPLPSTPSWRGAQLKQRDNFSFYWTLRQRNEVWFGTHLEGSELLCDWRSVGQSVLDIEPLWDSWPDFGCSQDSCDFVCRGASSLTGGRVCHVTGHRPFLCWHFVHIYLSFLRVIFSLTIFFYFFIFLGLQSRFCTAYYAYCLYTAQGCSHSLDNWSIVCLTSTELTITNMYLLQWSTVKVRSCACSLVI
jgi:hypothetical protein